MPRIGRMAATIVALLACASPSAMARSSSEADSSLGISAPHVLGQEDVHLYREIFAEERAGRFPAAKSRIAELSDRSLVGYAEAEHFLSPKARHIKVADLTEWLSNYNDLPIAGRVRALAEKKNRRHRVEIPSVPSVHRRGGGYEETDLPEAPLASEAARTAQGPLEAAIHAGQPAQAQAVLMTLVADASVGGPDIARLSHRVAASYLAEGQDEAALKIAAAIMGSDRFAAPLLDWDAGIADYRLGKFADAAQRFETLAQVGSVPNYTRSAAAFWAARAYMQAGDPLRVVTLLTAAAREQPTFYGILAERLLGQQPKGDFSEPVLDGTSFEAFMQIPAAHRAVALWQIGETDTLAGEMDRAQSAIDIHQEPAFAALARRLDLPNLELRACEMAASQGVMLTGLFPVPRYAPPGGYRVDPALVLAFTRAESRFQPDAVSNVGARGLMQIMPGTAAHMEGVTPSDKMLAEPSYNLGLGQRYLTELLGQVDGNLVELAASYNAGPGAVTRWVGARGNMLDDPLLFIESIPASQTRNYVKRVLTYYWMYARRNGEAAPTLDETAQGKWPKYRPNGSHIATPPAQDLLVSDAAILH